MNLFYGDYTEVAIAMSYKFQRIVSHYLSFSKIQFI